MRTRLAFALAALMIVAAAAPALAQKFDVPAKGMQTFNLKDERGRNQASFSSKAPIEDISGTASGLGGTVSFDPANVPGTIKADITVEVASMKTGIDMRDDHMRGDKWLDAAKFPTITFTLTKLKDAKIQKGTELRGIAVGTFTLHGVPQTVQLPVTLTYMPASEKTKARAAGDLLVVRAKGKVSLTKAGVRSELLGSKVSDEIEFEFNAVGSNAVK
ncbi:MAG: YceI family protein [Ignavibacteria bacterium]|nr:YceI family protein [Ignavibacteria bacterium]